jgi:hypothetical protein
LLFRSVLDDADVDAAESFDSPVDHVVIDGIAQDGGVSSSVGRNWDYYEESPRLVAEKRTAVIENRRAVRLTPPATVGFAHLGIRFWSSPSVSLLNKAGYFGVDTLKNDLKKVAWSTLYESWRWQSPPSPSRKLPAVTIVCVYIEHTIIMKKLFYNSIFRECPATAEDQLDRHIGNLDFTLSFRRDGINSGKRFRYYALPSNKAETPYDHRHISANAGTHRHKAHFIREKGLTLFPSF